MNVRYITFLSNYKRPKDVWKNYITLRKLKKNTKYRSLIKVEITCILRQRSDFERWTKLCWTFKENIDLLDYYVFQICNLCLSFPSVWVNSDRRSLVLFRYDITYHFWHHHSACLQRNKKVLDTNTSCRIFISHFH